MGTTLDPSLGPAADGNAASNDGLSLPDNGDNESNDGSEDFSFRAFAAGTRPCSNDSPDWAEKTVPCANAKGIATIPASSPTAEPTPKPVTETPTETPSQVTSLVPLDLSNQGIATPASSPPDDITQSEFSSPTPEPAPELVTSNDAGLIRDVLPSPTEEPSSGAPQASNDIGDIDGLFTASPAITFVASNADEEEYRSFYSCSVSSEEELGQESSSDGELPLRFDYEIHTATGVEDVTAVLSTFERQLTNGVASSLGLADCPNVEVGVTAVEMARTVLPPWGGRRMLRKGHTSGGRDRGLEGVVILGMSVDPADELDTDIASCTSSPTLGAPSKCSPVIGAMTVWMTKGQGRQLRHLANADLQEEMLLNAVATYIEESEESYLNDELLHVRYVGQRDLERGADLIVANTITEGSMESVELGGGGTTTAVIVGLAMAGTLLALLVMGAVWAFRRRREAEEGLEPEPGAFPGLTPESNAVTESFEAQMHASDEPMHEGDSPGPGADAPGDELSIRTGREVAPSSLAALGGASTLVPNLVPQPFDSPNGKDSVLRQLSYSQDEKGGDEGNLPLSRTLDSAPEPELFLENPPTIVEADDNYALKVVEDNAGAVDGLERLDNTTIPTTNDEDDVLRSNGLIM